MSKPCIYISIILFFLLHLSILQLNAQCWVNLPAPTNLEDLAFIHPDTGWVINKAGEVFKTENCGESWENLSQIEIEEGSETWKMEFLNQSVGYVIPLHYQVRRIYKTTDGGKSWEQLDMFVENFTGGAVKNLDFVTTQLGFVAGSNSALFKTIDGGQNWTLFKQVSNITHNRSLSFFNEDIGYIGSNFNTSIYKMSNGKDLVLVDVNTNFIKNDKSAQSSFFFLSKEKGWVTALANEDPVQHYLSKTNNGGDSWTTFSNVTPRNIRAINFISETVGWVSGTDGTFKTTDGGTNWVEERGSRLNELKLFNELSGWGLDNNKELQRYQACESPACISDIKELVNQNIIAVNTSFSWDAPTQAIDGYFLTLGTFQGGNDLIDTFLTTNTFQPIDLLPESESLFLSVIPKNNKTGSPNDCSIINFSTKEKTVECQEIIVKESQSICAHTCINFKDQTYCEAGTYPFNFLTNAGCDSLLQFELQVKEYTISEESISIQEGEQFDWNGNIYEQAGIYYDTISKSEECFIEALNLRVESVLIDLDKLCIEQAKTNIPNALYLYSQQAENRFFDPSSVLQKSGCNLNSTTLKLTIQNRWGEVVFETPKGAYQSWEGQQNNGKLLPYNTYYYQFQYGKNRKEVLIGSINLLR